MKILSLCILLWSTFAHAETLRPIVGKYIFDGKFEVLQKFRSEKVYSGNQKGQDRIAFLQKNGHICVRKMSDYYLCRHFESVKNTENEVKEKVLAEMSNVSISVNPSRGNPSLLGKTDMLEEWLVPQEIEWNQKRYDSYRYLISQEIHKILLGAQSDFTLLPAVDGSIGVPLLFGKTESNTVYYTYMVVGNLSRK